MRTGLAAETASAVPIRASATAIGTLASPRRLSSLGDGRLGRGPHRAQQVDHHLVLQVTGERRHRVGADGGDGLVGEHQVDEAGRLHLVDQSLGRLGRLRTVDEEQAEGGGDRIDVVWFLFHDLLELAVAGLPHGLQPLDVGGHLLAQILGRHHLRMAGGLSMLHPLLQPESDAPSDLEGRPRLRRLRLGFHAGRHRQDHDERVNGVLATFASSGSGVGESIESGRQQIAERAHDQGGNGPRRRGYGPDRVVGLAPDHGHDLPRGWDGESGELEDEPLAATGRDVGERGRKGVVDRHVLGTQQARGRWAWKR